MIGKRARSIILEIIKKEEVRIQDLAGQYHVSERTIRSDLEEIDYFLKGHQCSRMVRKGRGTVSIKGDSSVAMLIYQLINENNVVTASYSPNERLLEIFYLLATAEEPVKLEDLAEHLLVSKSTIVKDLERLKAIYETCDFRFQGNREGMELSGNEEAIRRQLVKRFVQNMDKHAVMDLTNLIMHKEQITYKVFWRLFEDVDLERIRGCIEFLKAGLGMQLSDLEYLNLMGHFCILLKRAALRRHPEIQEQETDSPVVGFLTDSVYRYLEEKAKLHPGEKQYLRYMIYLASAPLYAKEHPMPKEPVKEDIRRCMEAFDCMGNAGIEEGLWRECELLYWERQLDVPYSRPLVQLEEGPFLEIYERVAGLLEKWKLTRDETWRIAAHFIAGTDFSGQRGHKRVLVVSDKPSTFIALLIDRILPMFDIEIVGITGLAQLEKNRKTMPVDCILSTIHLHMKDVEVVEVHPLLTLKDIGTLEEHFFLRKLPVKQPFGKSRMVADTGVRWSRQEVEYQSAAVAHTLSQMLLSCGGCTLSLEKSIEDAMEKQQLPLVIGNTRVLNNRNYTTVKKNRVVGCRVKGEPSIESVIFVSVDSPQQYLEVVSDLLLGGIAG